MIHELVRGFEVAIQLSNLFACFVGVLVGTLVGVLPGIGPAAAIAMLLPITFNLTPVAGIIMLAGIFYGAQYGGSTTSILLNMPGESSSIMTCLDGHEMALQGKAGPALGIAAFASLIAGTLSVLGLMLVAAPLAKAALKLGPPEYFSLVCFGFTVLVHLTGNSVIKATLVGLLGLILSYIGLDTITGVPRFNFGITEFMSGLDIVPVIMGLFGVAEVFINIEMGQEKGEIVQADLKGMWPSLKDWKDSLVAILQGSFVGFFLGVLPGGGATLPTFVSYWLQRKISKHPDKLGTGSIEGVAAPEAANNAGVGGSFIPLMILGIPTNPVIAMIMGALIIHGIRPGPEFMQNYPQIFWGFVASMYIGNVMLLILNLPLIPAWVQVLKIPYKVLFPLILLFTIIGSYSVNNSVFDLAIMVVFGILGYLFKKFDFQAAPLIMAFILGPLFEESFRQSLVISRGSFQIFFTRPVSLALLLLSAAFILSSGIPAFRGALRKVTS